MIDAETPVNCCRRTAKWQAMRASCFQEDRSGILGRKRSFVRSGAPILKELNNKRGEGDEQEDVYQASLMQQEF